jgi:hypothetical protein
MNKYYGVFFTENGYITNDREPDFVYCTKSVAKSKAALLRSRLTRGEKTHFKWSYVTKEIK